VADLGDRSWKRYAVSSEDCVTTDGWRAEEHDVREDVGWETVDPWDGRGELRTPVTESSRAMAENVEMLLEEPDLMVELLEVIVDLTEVLAEGESHESIGRALLDIETDL
jgi:hypothetical protein